eukprot:756013-Hanusia_phi.AAC.3
MSQAFGSDIEVAEQQWRSEGWSTVTPRPGPGPAGESPGRRQIIGSKRGRGLRRCAVRGGPRLRTVTGSDGGLARDRTVRS